VNRKDEVTGPCDYPDPARVVGKDADPEEKQKENA
jgi:hypothetical protein